MQTPDNPALPADHTVELSVAATTAPVTSSAPTAARPSVPDAVRAKFKCEGIIPDKDANARVILRAVTNGSPENDTFFKWTPSGVLDFHLLAASTASMFEVNKEYYLDITPA